MSRSKELVNAHMRGWFNYHRLHSDIERAYHSVKRAYR